MESLILLAISILPVIVLMIYIYRQDKYEKEPLGLLALTFFGGMIAIPMTLIMVGITNAVYYSDSVFHSAFIEAGFPEELSKFVILFLIIWWNKNFNEHMDGIVYATFVSLGFACVENILYVLGGGIGTGIMRAVISVPGHFLFGVLMGYFLSLAKFNENKKFLYILLAILVPACVHGMFDWLLMAAEVWGNGIALLLIFFFILLDIFMWIAGIKSIRKHRENSPFKNPVTPPTQDMY